MLSDDAKVEDVPVADLLRAVKQVIPPDVDVQLYVQAGHHPALRVKDVYELWGRIGELQLVRIYTVGQLLATARRESDRIQSQRLRDTLDGKVAAEIAGMA